MKNTTYVSDITKFVNTLLDKPEIREKQKNLRATWWDTDFVDLDEQKKYAESDVKQPPYVYFSYPESK